MIAFAQSERNEACPNAASLLQPVLSTDKCNPVFSVYEGTEVDVMPRDLRVAGDPFLQAVAGAAKRRTHWPRDYALNHGFYASGEPEKAFG
jgi:hypothetical protein